MPESFSRMGQIYWSNEGWFGTLFGSSCWMFFGSILTGLESLQTGLIVFSLFLFSIFSGSLLWMGREKVSGYIACQFLILAVGASSLLSIYTFWKSGLWHVISGYFGLFSAETSFLVVAIVVPVLMIGLCAAKRCPRSGELSLKFSE